MKARRTLLLVAVLWIAGPRPAEAQCTYSVSPTTFSVGSTQSSNTITIITGTQCSWTATSQASWITVQSGASGTGMGSVVFVVAANTSGGTRTGTLIVAGQTITVTQGASSCTYSVSPTTFSLPSTQSSNTITIITGTQCSWASASQASWITIQSGASGTGMGSVVFVVATNTTTSARTGTLLVAGQTITVTQAAGSCTYSVSPTTFSLPSTESSNTITMISGTQCSWTATSQAGWITVTSGASGTGMGSIVFLVATNPTTSARTGTLTVAGQTVTVNQAAGSCSYSVSPTSFSVQSTQSSNTITVISGTQCGWTATSQAGWITISSGASGTGMGSVVFVVATNSTTSARTGTLTVAGQTVTVTQAAGSCTYSVSPTSVSVPPTQSSNTISVVSGTQCGWTSASQAAWITISSGASGTGMGSVVFVAAANSTSSSRTGTLTVAGQTVTVTQAAGTSSQPPAAPGGLRIVR